MKCAVHTDVDATGYCRNCGKALCAACARDVRGILYCETCLADILTRPQSVPPSGGPRPGAAFALGFVPGLGAVYNGQYSKALTHVIIFIAFIGALNSEFGDPLDAMLGVGLAAFIVYMAIDSLRCAKARLRGELSPGAPAGGQVAAVAQAPSGTKTNLPAGPIVLIVLGVFFLLARHFNMSAYMREFWPVLLIVLGALMLWKRVGQR